MQREAFTAVAGWHPHSRHKPTNAPDQCLQPGYVSASAALHLRIARIGAYQQSGAAQGC